MSSLHTLIGTALIHGACQVCHCLAAYGREHWRNVGCDRGLDTDCRPCGGPLSSEQGYLLAADSWIHLIVGSVVVGMQHRMAAVLPGSLPLLCIA